MRQDAAIDGFRLAYDRTGPAVLLLHGWPGDAAPGGGAPEASARPEAATDTAVMPILAMIMLVQRHDRG